MDPGELETAGAEILAVHTWRICGAEHADRNVVPAGRPRGRCGRIDRLPMVRAKPPCTRGIRDLAGPGEMEPRDELKSLVGLKVLIRGAVLLS